MVAELAYEISILNNFVDVNDYLQSYLIDSFVMLGSVDMTTFEIVKNLAKKQNISIVELEEKLGFSRNSLYAWKKSKPSVDKLQAVADYFHVSTDYLLGRTDNTSLDSDNDLEVEEALNSMRSYQGKPVSDSEREVLRDIIKAYLDSQDKDE